MGGDGGGGGLGGVVLAVLLAGLDGICLMFLYTFSMKVIDWKFSLGHCCCGGAGSKR